MNIQVGSFVLYNNNMMWIKSIDGDAVVLRSGFDTIHTNVNELKSIDEKYKRYVNVNTFTDIVVKDKKRDTWYNTKQIAGEKKQFYFMFWSFPLWWKSKQTIIEAGLDYEEYPISYFENNESHMWDDEEKEVFYKPRVLFFTNDNKNPMILYFNTFEEASEYAESFINTHKLYMVNLSRAL